MNDYEFILKYKNMRSIKRVCQDLGIQNANVLRNTTTKENIHKVANELKGEVLTIYFNIIAEEVLKDGYKTDTL